MKKGVLGEERKDDTRHNAAMQVTLCRKVNM